MREVEKTKFKVLPKVAVFSLNNLDYLPGDVVELPETYLGESWLEPVKDVRKPKPKVEPVKPEEPVVLEDVSETRAILETGKFKRRKH